MQNDKALTGHVGDIEIFQRCDGSQFPAIAGEPGAAPDSGAGAAPGGFGPGTAGGGGGSGGGGGGARRNFLPKAYRTTAWPKRRSIPTRRTWSSGVRPQDPAGPFQSTKQRRMGCR